MSQADLDVLWRLADGQALVHRTWDGETLLFNDISGDTHLLDARALAVLLALQAGTQTEIALCAAAGLDADATGRAQLAGMLADLEVLSLIQSVC